MTALPATRVRDAALELLPGNAWALLGRAGSGKTALLERWSSGAALARAGGLSPRSTPLGIVSRAGASGPRAAEILRALELVDLARLPLRSATPSTVAACEFAGVLASRASVKLVDGQFDRLDPWAFRGALAFVRGDLQRGACYVVASSRLDLAEHLGRVAIVSGGEVRRAGLVHELVAAIEPNVVEVETDDPTTCRALCEPLALQVEEIDGGLRIMAADGQALAARLLTHGYGAVRAVLARTASLGDVLDRLL